MNVTFVYSNITIERVNNKYYHNFLGDIILRYSQLGALTVCTSVRIEKTSKQNEINLANAKIIEQKALVVDEIKNKFENAKSVVVFDPRGLKVSEVTELRRALRDSGSDYKVYKNTMIRFAAKGTEFEALEPHLEGPTALAVSKEDATAPARVLAEFAKKAEKLELKGGVVEGTYYDAAGIGVIASIPSRDVLLGRLLGSMQSPITNFARVLNQIAEKNGEGAEAPAEA